MRLLALDGTQAYVATVGALSAIIVAAIGVWSVKTSRGETKKAETSKKVAMEAAELAAIYAAALHAKDAVIEAQGEQIQHLEGANRKLQKTVAQLSERVERLERRGLETPDNPIPRSPEGGQDW